MKRELLLCVLAAGVLLAGCDDKGLEVVSSVSMRRTLVLEVGESSPLWPTILPEKAADRTVVWFEEDPSVAIYDEATKSVIAVGVGTARIGASVGGKSATCEVTVVEPPEVVDLLPLIPDPAFRAALSRDMEKWDLDGDGIISIPEVSEKPVNLDISGQGIRSLEGIEHFNLYTLDCSDNPLAELDLSGLAHLASLKCSGIGLTELDLTGFIKLTWLECADNQLTEIDLYYCVELWVLDCSGNLLTSLDVSYSPGIVDIQAGDNALTGMDITNCPDLRVFECTGNPGVEGVFAVRSWFDNENIPYYHPSYPNIQYYEFSTEWEYEGQTVRADYQKVD